MSDLKVAVNGFLRTTLAGQHRRALARFGKRSGIAQRSATIFASLAHTKAKVEHLMARPVVDITADDLEAALIDLAWLLATFESIGSVRS